jgi:dihydrofolate reductase
MGSVVADITMSLDGFVTGPNDDVGRGLGDGGECLHSWVMGGEWTYQDRPPLQPAEVDRRILDRMPAEYGASIIGRRMFDVTGGWGGEPPFGIPVFVLTHREPPADVGAKFTFVRDGIASALEQAKATAGGRNVTIGGGANAIQQYVAAGLVDELRIHLAPVLLGAGRRLFDQIGTRRIRLERTGLAESPFATHLTFRVAG